MRRRLLPGAGFAVLCFSSVLFAHHSLNNGYDLDRTIQLTGVVTGVDWTNPHVRYFVDGADSGGSIRNWNVEALGPQGMIRSGIEKTTIKIGDRITVSGYAGKNMSSSLKQAIAMTRITLPGGKSVEVDPTKWMLIPPQPAK